MKLDHHCKQRHQVRNILPKTNIGVYIYITSQLQFSLPPLLPVLPRSVHNPQSTPAPSLFRKGQVSHEYQQNMAYQVAVRLSTSPCIQAGQDNPLWGTGSPKQSAQPLFPLLGVPPENKATQLWHACRGPRWVFNSWVVLHCINAPQHLYPGFSWGTSRSLLGSAYYE